MVIFDVLFLKMYTCYSRFSLEYTEKMGSKWTKKLRPQVRKQMKAAYKERMSSSNPEL